MTSWISGQAPVSQQTGGSWQSFDILHHLIRIHTLTLTRNRQTLVKTSNELGLTACTQDTLAHAAWRTLC